MILTHAAISLCDLLCQMFKQAAKSLECWTLVFQVQSCCCDGFVVVVVVIAFKFVVIAVNFEKRQNAATCTMEFEKWWCQDKCYIQDTFSKRVD